MTLTYGGGDCPESRFLRKSDTTAFFKALRNDGHKVRYFATGEYGSRKGRAHWHVVLFWHSPMPHLEFRKNIHVEWWPHGHTFWTDADSASIRYVMKYINKDQHDDNALKSMAMSRKPILGHAYFVELAKRYVDQGLSPQRPFYKFRDVLDKQGRPLEFYMPPLVAEGFILEYILEFKRRHPGKHWPASELVDKYEDKLCGYIQPVTFDKRQFRDAPWMLPPSGGKILFDEKLNSYYCLDGSDRLFWSFDEEGQRQWQRNLVTETEAEKLRVASDARKEFGRSNAR